MSLMPCAFACVNAAPMAERHAQHLLRRAFRSSCGQRSSSSHLVGRPLTCHASSAVLRVHARSRAPRGSASVGARSGVAKLRPRVRSYGRSAMNAGKGCSGIGFGRRSAPILAMLPGATRTEARKSLPLRAARTPAAPPRQHCATIAPFMCRGASLLAEAELGPGARPCDGEAVESLLPPTARQLGHGSPDGRRGETVG